ncbi:glycine-tRNA ligase, partial [Perilla frutescens var. hirtella]
MLLSEITNPCEDWWDEVLTRDHVDNLSDKHVDNEVEIEGPPISLAFDQQGNPTK